MESISARLGLNVPYEWWPTQSLLKSFEAAGFGHVQVPSPPLSVLLDPAARRQHASTLAPVLGATRLEAVVHGPGRLVAGTRESDAALRGLIAYTSAVGARQFVYHVAHVPVGHRSARRLAAELDSLERLARVATRRGVTIAMENLAPVFPGPLLLNHRPDFVAAMVRRIASPSVRMCLDVGHANIVAALRGMEVRALIEPVLDVVSLFHIHDNFGARTDGSPQCGFDPLRLDLHLPPGGGRVPWDQLSPLLCDHRAPMLLEIHPPHRPSPLATLEVARRVLSGRAVGERPEPLPAPV